MRPPEPTRRAAAASAPVDVVVIGHQDAAHVTDAVRSALAQGPTVGRVVAVDDGSSDGSPESLDRLAAREPRLTVLRLPTNSGGCGTPRNAGLDRVTAPYVMFLDSDDVLRPDAARVLLDAATEGDAQVAAGLCVRRELPSGREVPWQPELYAARTVIAHPSHRPRLVHDTLCVNKLYRTDFLRAHGIRFPDGPFRYEDIVFTARVLAAGPRLALVPDPVYVWHVRRSAKRLSISLDRAATDNWTSRTHACRTAHRVLRDAGRTELARAARAKFLDHELRMYVREPALWETHRLRAWWDQTRAFLAEYEAADWDRSPGAPGGLIARVLLASPEPRDLPRLRALAARPARLLPPYARAPDGTPVWSRELPLVTLEGLLTRPVGALPLTVDAELRLGPRSSRLSLRLHDLYDRVGAAAPRGIEIEWRSREDGHPVGAGATPLSPRADGTVWIGATDLDLAPLATRGTGTWDLRLRVLFRHGASREVLAHAREAHRTPRRRALPDARHGVLLVQAYATHSGALALRLAPGPRGVAAAARRRLLRFAGR
ncbi:glycosyltransferase family 2 protein [Streptomyces sp. ZYX-F-203]